jgi:hypothetical protein
MDGTDLQRLLVYRNMYLAPQAAFGTAVLAGIPLTTRQAHAKHAAEMAPSPSALIPVLSTARQLLLAATRGDKQVQWSC